MKLTCNTTALLESLDKFVKETTHRMEAMVREFSYNVSMKAIENTPLGDAVLYQSLYEMRQQTWGLKPEEGYARGSWQVALDGSLDKQELYGQNSGTTAVKAIETHLMNYKLGEEVIIGNNAHYISLLNNDSNPYSKQAPNGIMKPTLAIVELVYSLKLDDYYNRG